MKTPQVEERKIKEAYKIVLKHLRTENTCREYSFGCFQCMTERLRKDLSDVYDLSFGPWPKVNK